MVRKIQYRRAIIEFMEEKKKPVSTQEVWDYLNSRFKYGVSMNCVSNLLAKNSLTENISPRQKYISNYKTSQTTYWRLR